MRGILIPIGKEVTNIIKDINCLWRQEELYWSQRSRLKWLKFGDKNSRFFHATIVQRRDRNKLYRLKDKDGVWVEGHSKVMTAFEDYFRGIYVQAEGSHNVDCLHVIPNLISVDTNQKLTANVNCYEIEKAMFCLGALKSPGPDGLNGEFFQKNWEVITKDVIAAVCDFFNSGNIADCINDILVALIPKIPHPENIGQLCPIIFCNFIYKIISKIMVARLKPFLNKSKSPINKVPLLVGDLSKIIL